MITKVAGPHITMELCPLMKKQVYDRAKELMQGKKHPMLSCIDRAVRECIPGAVTQWKGFTLFFFQPECPTVIYCLS